jgi:clan AA aspartic protease
MGMVHAEIELINPFDLEAARRNTMDQDEVKRMYIRAMVDTGSWMLCINENIQSYLDLPIIGKRRLQLANSEVAVYDEVGPAILKIEGRQTSCNALVLPGDSEPLLGSYPMEDLDVMIHPQRQKLVFGPGHSPSPFMKVIQL